MHKVTSGRHIFVKNSPNLYSLSTITTLSARPKICHQEGISPLELQDVTYVPECPLMLLLCPQSTTARLSAGVLNFPTGQ